MRVSPETAVIIPYLQMMHVVAKVDKRHFSKNEFFIDFNLFTKTNFQEKKIVLILNQFLVINSLICRTWQQVRMELWNFKRDLLETAKCDFSTFAKTSFKYINAPYSFEVPILSIKLIWTKSNEVVFRL